ncbi:hypothetical protein ABID14_001441 [Peptoniphilus olsenii]|uniref:Uncharacterized protein n=1 Tax=Peptoniphilus olsenii TaxID=411570 RepID=A0ABV2JAL0_9FIRM
MTILILFKNHKIFQILNNYSTISTNSSYVVSEVCQDSAFSSIPSVSVLSFASSLYSTTVGSSTTSSSFASSHSNATCVA